MELTDFVTTTNQWVVGTARFYVKMATDGFSARIFLSRGGRGVNQLLRTIT